MSTCTPRPPHALTTPFTIPPACTVTLKLTTYNLTATPLSLPPFRGGPPPLSSPLRPQVYQTTDLSYYGVVAAFATSPPGSSGPRFHDRGCYPPRFDELRAAWAWNNNAGRTRGEDGGCGVVPTYYSPGVCPSRWTSTGIVTASAREDEKVETTATCCPVGFTVPAEVDRGDVPLYCESVITKRTDAYDIDKGSWTTVTAGAVRAEGIEVRWRAGDGLGADPGSGTTLSAGAKAGIGVGVGLGSVAVAMGAVAMYFRRRRRERKMKGKQQQKKKDEEASEDGMPSEVQGKEVRPGTPELAADGEVVEIAEGKELKEGPETRDAEKGVREGIAELE